MKLLIFAALVIAIPVCHAGLPKPLLNMLRAENIPATSLGVLIQGLEDEVPLLEHNTDTAFNPASVMKLVTTYAALHILGPEYRWKTEFYLDGKLVNGTLSGSLSVKGYGDPYLVEETLLPVMRSIRHKGLQHITDKLVIDNSYFTESQQDPAAFDNRPYQAYNASPSALMTNFQATRFTLTPDVHSGKIKINTWPASSELKIDNKMTLVNGKCHSRDSWWPHMWFGHKAGQLTARFKGDYSRQCGQNKLHRVLVSPASLFYGAFYPAWRCLDGSLANGYRQGRVPEGAKPFHTYYSKTLVDIIRLINKHSSNIMSKQLLLTIGAQSGHVPATMESGRQIIKQWMRAEGIDTTGFIIDNGSGLSRDARATVKTLNQLIRHQWQSPWMPEMLSSLSILGKDGTGRKRFKHRPLAGNMHIKTGLLNDVRTMAGIFHSKTGKRYIVISLQNHPNIHQFTGTRIQDTLLRWLDTQG